MREIIHAASSKAPEMVVAAFQRTGIRQANQDAICRSASFHNRLSSTAKAKWDALVEGAMIRRAP